MEILNMVERIGVVLLDTNGTLVDCEKYLRIGRKEELRALAAELGWLEDSGWSLRYAEIALNDAKKKVEKRTGQSATTLQVIEELGLDRGWWIRTRNACYRPEQHIQADESLVAAVEQLSDCCQVGVISSHSFEVTRRTLSALGFNRLLRRMTVFGQELIPTAKGNPESYRTIATAFNLPSNECLLISDNRQVAVKAAVEAGMASIAVTGPEETKKACHNLLQYRESETDTDQTKEFLLELA